MMTQTLTQMSTKGILDKYSKCTGKKHRHGWKTQTNLKITRNKLKCKQTKLNGITKNRREMNSKPISTQQCIEYVKNKSKGKQTTLKSFIGDRTKLTKDVFVSKFNKSTNIKLKKVVKYPYRRQPKNYIVGWKYPLKSCK